jgi:hypothetical protein
MSGICALYQCEIATLLHLLKPIYPRRRSFVLFLCVQKPHLPRIGGKILNKNRR